MNFEYEEALKAQQKVGSCDVARRPSERCSSNIAGTQDPKPKTENYLLRVARFALTRLQIVLYRVV
jgi:hypothetical protein